MKGHSQHNPSLIGGKNQAKFENDCVLTNGHRIKITQSNLMILVSFSSARVAWFEGVKRYGTFRSQATENPPFRFLWDTRYRAFICFSSFYACCVIPNLSTQKKLNTNIFQAIFYGDFFVCTSVNTPVHWPFLNIYFLWSEEHDFINKIKYTQIVVLHGLFFWICLSGLRTIDTYMGLYFFYLRETLNMYMNDNDSVVMCFFDSNCLCVCVCVCEFVNYAFNSGHTRKITMKLDTHQPWTSTIVREPSIGSKSHRHAC